MIVDESDEATKELRKITKLLVVLVTKDQAQTVNIATLSKVGFEPREIADFLGTTRNTVSVALSQLRNKAKVSPRSGSKGRTERNDDQ